MSIYCRGGGGGRWEGFGGVTWFSVEKEGGRVNRRQQNMMMGEGGTIGTN